MDTVTKPTIATEFLLRDCNEVFVPEFFRPGKSLSERQALQYLLQSGQVFRVHDELRSQIAELIKSLRPNLTWKGQELDNAIDNHIGNVHSDDYGVWVFYPWSGRLVHLLDEEEFIEARTNRNRNKITREEQAILDQKKVGVIGLSVGSSVSLTMAMERMVGELRIADFDILELTNLNRIRSGVHNMGLSKVTIVAREIAEIDPFLKVTCYHEGINEENLDAFITYGGKLDVLIDECDGLDIKIACRERAKVHGIPVLMEASERGTVDVERFDLEPDRPILHGLLADVDPIKAKAAKTNEEKMPYMMKIVGVSSLSDRMKSSMLEITQTVTTWPQLASAVTYGGGMTADICRRMLLDQYRESGRYFVDIADIVADGSPKVEINLNDTSLHAAQGLREEKQMDFKHIAGIIPPLQTSYFSPANEQIRQMVSTAIKAPSGGNNQPWRWYYAEGTLHLIHEPDASTAYLDYRHRGAYIGLGAALENLELEAHNMDIRIESEIIPDEDSLLIARIRFQKGANQDKQTWFEAYYPWLDKRSTNRRVAVRTEISPEKYSALMESARTTSGAQLHIKHSESEMQVLGKIVGKADRALMTCERSHEEFYNEIKWTPEDAEHARSGIDIRTIDLTNTELAGFQLARKYPVVKNLIKWGGGGAFEKLGKKCVERSAGIGLLTMPDYSRPSFIEGGRAMQRVWTKAAALGIAIQPLSAAIFLFARLTKGSNEGLTPEMISLLSEVRPLHERLFQLDDTTGEIFLFRMHEATDMYPSMRKPLESMLFFKE